MDAALAEVPIHGRLIAVAVDDGEELAQKGSELFGGDGGVLPTLPRAGVVRDEDRSAQGRFPDAPDALGFVIGVELGGGLLLEITRGGYKVLGLAVGVFVGIGAEFAEQEAIAFGQQLYIIDGEILAQHAFDEVAIKALQADGLERKDSGDVVGSDEGAGEPQHD